MARASFLAVALLLAVQATLLAMTFPAAEILSDKPLLHIDNAAHWYRITFAVNTSDDGVTNGYDPYFNAGTVAGTVANPAAKVAAGLAVAAGDRLDPQQVWKIYTVALALLAMMCVPLALSWLRLDGLTVTAGALFAFLLWWVSMFRWYHTAGLVSFVFGAYLALPYCALICGYLRGEGGFVRLVGLGLLGALGLLIHPLFGLPIALFTLLYFVLHLGELHWPRTLALVVIVPVLSVLPNLFWLHEVFIAEPLTVRVDGVVHQVYVGADKIWRELLGVWQEPAQGSKMYPLLMLAALSSLGLAHFSDERRLLLAFVLTGLFCIVYAAFAATIELAAYYTQPNRFAPVGYLFLVIPAAAGLAAAWDTLRDGEVSAARRAVGVVIVAACIGLTLINVNEVRREVSSSADIGHYGAVPPRVTGIGPYTQFALDWLENETQPGARVLFETSRARIHDGAHIAGYLAYTSQREFIGGHYIDSYFADFTQGKIFNREISELTHEQFFDYAALYNIGWVMAFSEQSKAYLSQVPGVLAGPVFEELATYTIARSHNYFLSGDGEVVSRDHNELVLDKLAGSSVILKYHYMQGLVADPPAQIEPVYLADDPNPFIRLISPPPRLVLSRR